MTERAIPMLLFLVLLLVSAASLEAQDNPLNFSDASDRIGFEIGISSNWQSGLYRTGCGLFDAGGGLSMYLAAAYDKPFNDNIRFEGLLGYQSRSVESRYTSSETVGINTTSGPVDAVIDFENIGTASFSYIFAQPSVKFYPIENVYAGGGVSANFLLSATTQYRKDITSPTVFLDELGLSEVYYSDQESTDPYSKVFDEENRSDAASLTFDGVIYVGAEFKIGKRQSVDGSDPISTDSRRRLAIGPRIQYVLPFVAALTDDPYAIKLNALQFLIGLRYEL